MRAILVIRIVGNSIELFQNQYFIAYKQAKRRDDDIAIVNLALNVFFEPGTSVIQKAFMAFGGMAPTTVLAKKTCQAIVGRCFHFLLH